MSTQSHFELAAAHDHPAPARADSTLRRLAQVFGLILLGACSNACSSHNGPESTSWLFYEQADQSSRYVMTANTDGIVHVAAEGELAGDRRPVGVHGSEDVLSADEQRTLADLFSPDLIDTYERNSERNLRTEYAVDRTFAARLDSSVPDSPVSRSVGLGIPGTVSDAETLTMLSQLNKVMIAVWDRGKTGTNPGIPEPWQQ
jgi:hypothetical protein